MPIGATVTVSVPQVPDQRKEGRLQVGPGTIQTWPNWLAIAFTRVQEAYLARQRIVTESANGIDPTTGRLINEEYQASLQAISAAVFALDAFYGVLDGMITIPETERAARTQRGVGRAIWVADAIIRATARMPNSVRKDIRKNIRIAFKVRNLAVHPPYAPEPFAIHPALQDVLVPQRWIDYSFEPSMKIVTWTVEAMSWAINHPQSQNSSLAAWAPIASKLLHPIIDPFTTLDANSPLRLALRPSASRR
jgi:hypothetical protein